MTSWPRPSWSTPRRAPAQAAAQSREPHVIVWPKRADPGTKADDHPPAHSGVGTGESHRGGQGRRLRTEEASEETRRDKTTRNMAISQPPLRWLLVKITQRFKNQWVSARLLEKGECTQCDRNTWLPLNANGKGGFPQAGGAEHLRRVSEGDTRRSRAPIRGPYAVLLVNARPELNHEEGIRQTRHGCPEGPAVH